MAERSAEGPLDLTYAALASPTRRAILEMLRGEQARVTDVARRGAQGPGHAHDLAHRTASALSSSSPVAASAIAAASPVALAARPSTCRARASALRSQKPV